MKIFYISESTAKRATKELKKYDYIEWEGLIKPVEELFLNKRNERN